MYIKIRDVLMLPGAINVFVFPLTGTKALIVDTGSGKERGRKIFKVLNHLGLSEVSIFNTHHHSDHIGGNSYLQGKFNASIYSEAKEACFIENPYFEPFAIYGLADPLVELKGRELLAKPSLVTNKLFLDEAEELDVDFSGSKLKVVSIPGHSLGQVGILTPKKVFLAADSFFSKSILSKYGVPFHSNTEEYLNSLKKILDYLNGEKVKIVVPSHGYPLKANEAENLVKLNVSRVFEVERLIVSAVKKGVNRVDSLTVYLLNCYGVKKSILQFYLTIVPVKAMVSYLENKERIRCEITDEGFILKAF